MCLIDKMKRLSQSGSSNFCPELRKNALLISQSHFSNFALHVITKEIRRAEREYMNMHPPPPQLTLYGPAIVNRHLNISKNIEFTGINNN